MTARCWWWLLAHPEHIRPVLDLARRVRRLEAVMTR